jgi:hypothetical protein
MVLGVHMAGMVAAIVIVMDRTAAMAITAAMVTMARMVVTDAARAVDSTGLRF